MNTLKIRCPRCKNEFWVGEESSEQIIECRTCQQKIRVHGIEKSSCDRFDVVIDSIPSEHRVDLIGTIREMQGLGLKAAMAFVDHLPLTFMENISTVESESVKKRLEEAGAVVHLEAYEAPDVHAQQPLHRVSSNGSTQKQQQKNHENNCHERPRSSSNTKTTSKKPQHRSSSSSADGCAFTILLLIVLGIVALILWLCWSFVTGMPRLAFWLIVSVFWIIYVACGGLKLKPLALLCLIGTIAWGWWSHGINSLSSSARDESKVAASPRTAVHDYPAETQIKNDKGTVTTKCFLSGEMPLISEKYLQIVFIHSKEREERFKKMISLEQEIFPLKEKINLARTEIDRLSSSKHKNSEDYWYWMNEWDTNQDELIKKLGELQKILNPVMDDVINSRYVNSAEFDDEFILKDLPNGKYIFWIACTNEDRHIYEWVKTIVVQGDEVLIDVSDTDPDCVKFN